jgi:DNA-binding response OmpR family regulator
MVARMIVLADGDPTLLRLVEAYLVHRGYTVFAAGNCLEAMTAIRAVEPAVAILDSEMLWGEWRGICELMDADSQLAEIPLILLTDHADSCDGSSLRRCAPIQRLTKPFRLRNLELAILSSLGTVATRHPTTTTPFPLRE